MFKIMDKELMLNEIKSHYNIDGDSEFARFLGIKPQVLHNWKKRGTFDIDVIYTKCLNISAEWLITGQGEMFKNQQVEKKNDASEELEWKKKYENLQEKYTNLLEQHTDLLQNKLREMFEHHDKSSKAV